MSTQSNSPLRDCTGVLPSDVGIAATSPLSADQLNRWAALIAEGRHLFPKALSSADAQVLAIKVRELCRERLLNLTARAIAQHLRRTQRHSMEAENK